MGGRRLAILLLLAALAWPAAPLRAETSTAVSKTVTHTQTEQDEQSTKVDLTVIQDAHVLGSASADASIYEGLENNLLNEVGGDSVATIGDDGFAQAMGIVSINQSPGNNNNQGNVVSFAYAVADGDAILLSRGSGQVLNRDNTLDAMDTSRANVIEGGAFHDFFGALQINQSAGNLNNQNNLVAVAAGSRGIVAVSDAALGQQVARNTIRETNVIKHDIICSGAFSHVSGLVSINQSSGSGNNQTNMIVITVQQYH